MDIKNVKSRHSTEIFRRLVQFHPNTFYYCSLLTCLSVAYICFAVSRTRRLHVMKVNHSESTSPEGGGLDSAFESFILITFFFLLTCVPRVLFPSRLLPTPFSQSASLAPLFLFVCESLSLSYQFSLKLPPLLNLPAFLSATIMVRKQTAV